MTRINPAHVNPPRETTPEEAERDKRDMTRNEAEQAEKGPSGAGGAKPVDRPTPMPPD